MITLSLTSLTNTAKKRPEGYLQDVLARAEVDGDKVTLTSGQYQLLRAKYRPPAPPPAPTSGPGTEMKALLAKIGIVASPTCSCNKRAKIMDEKGCDWCEAHIDEIDGWLAEEARKRKLPYLSLAGKTLIHLSIRRARKNAAR